MSARKRVVLDASGHDVPADPLAGRTVEITRSFSFKLNLGNYQSCDFFCAEKTQCLAEEAEEVSKAVYEFCRGQVLASVKEVQAKQERKQA